MNMRKSSCTIIKRKMFACVFVQSSSGFSYGARRGRLNKKKKKTVNALIKGSRDPKKKVDFYPLVNHVKCCMTIDY